MSAVTHRYHIAAGGAVVALREIETRADAPTVKRAQRTHYLHRDHLGSIALITDAAGRKLERAGYSAWGQRINLNGFASDSTFKATAGAGYAFAHSAARNFHRGYTGHNTLEHLGLVHMNGRIYDPEIGRFLSADPFVQFPESTQGFNRYTYVNNNPLSYADPSGYFLKKLLRGVLGGDIRQMFPTLVGAVMCVGTAGIGCAVAAGAISGAIGGYMATGTLRGALTGAAIGAASAAISFKIGAHFGETGFSDFGKHLSKSLTHGLAQGAMSVAGGGRFGDGFLGGFSGSFMSPAVNRIKGGDLGARVARVTTAAIIGGTAAELGGGKFANGAVSGAFAAAIGNTTKNGTSDTERARTKTVRWGGEGEMPEHLRAVAAEINEGLAETASALNAKAAAGKLEYYDGRSEIQIFNETDHVIVNDIGFAKGHGFTAAQTNLVNGSTITTWYGLSAGTYLGTPDLNAFAVSHELAHALPGHAAYTFDNHSAYVTNPIPFENAADEYASILNGYRY